MLTYRHQYKHSVLLKQIILFTGKVNSIFGLTENLMPLLYVPLYTTVYTATMEVLPGAVFLMGATMTTPAVGVFL